MSRQRDDNIINVTITPEANDEITSYLKQIEEKQINWIGRVQRILSMFEYKKCSYV